MTKPGPTTSAREWLDPSARALAVVVLLGACVGGGSGDVGPNDERDPLRSGPQGNVAQFIVECGPSHRAHDDPIVHPGMTGMSHLHEFFGNVAVTADPDPERLLGAATSCERRSDTASYWVPALLDAMGEVVEPVMMTAYYRPGPSVDLGTVEPYPAGLMMVAGDALADEQQPIDTVAWGCGTGPRREPRPPDCRIDVGDGLAANSSSGLRLWVTFPDCWDGNTLTTGADSSHVTDSVAGECPATHPVPIPELQVAVDFPAADPNGLSLASGSIESAHADFWNVWDQDALDDEVRLCLNRDLVCGVTSRRGGP